MPQDLVDGVGEFLPGGALPFQDAPPLGGKTIETAAAFAGFLRPPTGDEATILETAKHGIERPDPEGEATIRPCFDQLADLVPVPGPRFQQREDEQFGAAFFQVVIRHGRMCASAHYISPKYMSVK